MHNLKIVIRPQVFKDKMEIDCTAICESLTQEQIEELAGKEITRLAQAHVREISGHDLGKDEKGYRPTSEDQEEWKEVVATSKMELDVISKMVKANRRTRETTQQDHIDKGLKEGKSPEEILKELTELVAARSKKFPSKT